MTENINIEMSIVDRSVLAQIELPVTSQSSAVGKQLKHPCRSQNYHRMENGNIHPKYLENRQSHRESGLVDVLALQNEWNKKVVGM